MCKNAKEFLRIREKDCMTDKKELELYFHIPFCVRKCAYCDFLSAPAAKEVQEEYMRALILETKGRADEYRDYRVSSVFIGGGTPSLVDAGQLAALLEVVREHYELSEDIEITIECNPGTLTKEKLKIYKSAGVNRLSIGLQSADNGELKTLGRIHTYEEFLEGYELAVNAGFTNINVDVMSALPGQSLASYENTLRKVLSLNPVPAHISAYSLIVEEGTPFFERDERGELNLPDEDCERRMYERTEEMLLEAGFARYEISNYAKKGFECRHNCGYWRRTEYVGFGIGAASLVNSVRFHNGSDIKEYLCDPLACREDFQELSLQEQMEEFMFLGLRMTEGVSCEEFSRKFGQDIREVYGAVIAENKQKGLLCEFAKGKEEPAGQEELAGQEVQGGRRLALTKKGLDVSNQVMADFLF